MTPYNGNSNNLSVINKDGNVVETAMFWAMVLRSVINFYKSALETNNNE